MFHHSPKYKHSYCSIYRGAGGSGDATADSSSEALLVRELAIKVQADADAAAASASAATSSASAAATSATNAASSATSAASSATSASTSATNAASSATNAASSATDAETAQAAAETAQVAAETAETNAETAATNAASSASAASTSATNASNSATSAATSATNAASSASAASTSATNAASSATSAAGSATTATTQASNASTSASNAATSETNAATSASTATTQAGLAATSASNAATSASNAASSASSASTSASNAATSETNAASSASTASSAASAALASLDSFDDRYLGAKSSEPTLDNDGNALASGALYFNTVSNTMKVYTGSVWVDAYADGATFLAKANNLSDLASVSTARSNLGLGTAATTAASDYLTATNPSYTGTLTGGTGVVNLGSGQFYKDASGNVGIGTSSPATKLTVKAATNVNMNFNTGNTASNARMIALNDAGNSLIGMELQASTHAFLINASDGMRIDSSGNVGIGTSSPSSKLNVVSSAGGTLAFFDQGASGVKIGTYISNTIWGVSDSTVGTGLFGSGNSYLYLATAGVERMRIDSSGNLLVGTTSHADGSMFQSVSLTPLNCYRADSSGGNGAFGVYSDVGGTKTVRAYIKNDGGLANYSANNVNLSDERLKKDISLAGNYLDKLCAIPVKNFRYKDQNESDDITLGVIAQDVLSVAPELVSIDGFGTDSNNKENYLSIYQTDLQYAMLKAIQEQQAMIETLTTRLNALEGK